MPSNYAHHRFGQETFRMLPPKLQKTIRRFPQLYTVGLHGPDLFFYFSPFWDTTVGALGKQYHQKSGREYFAEVCKMYRERPTEGAQSYLYGLLAHYCLDSICHPFVHLQTDTGPIGHTELEVEFDRHLMMLDGIPSPETEDFSPWFRLTRGECLTVSEFYPPATAGNIHTAVWNIRCISRLLAMKNRPLLAKGISLFGDSIRQQMILSPANHKCMHLNKDMEAHYQQALEKFPVLVEQLFDHLEKGAPLGDDFAPTFG